jgi:hypothetical protein
MSDSNDGDLEPIDWLNKTRGGWVVGSMFDDRRQVLQGVNGSSVKEVIGDTAHASGPQVADK